MDDQMDSVFFKYMYNMHLNMYSRLFISCLAFALYSLSTNSKAIQGGKICHQER